MSDERPGLVAFLSARLDEDEAVAKATGVPDVRYPQVDTMSWVQSDDGYEEFAASVGPVGDRPPQIWRFAVCDPLEARHIARQDQARVLREVEAKRKIVARIERDSASIPFGHRFDFAQTALRELATVYSDHPDYQQEWALEGPPEHD